MINAKKLVMSAKQNNNTNDDFKPKSLSNDFELLDIQDKADAIYDDAINYSPDDASLSILISNQNNKNEYCNLLAQIKYSDLPVEELTDKILKLAKICYEYGIKAYQIINTILTSDKVKNMKCDIIKQIIKQMLEINELDANKAVEEVAASNNIIVENAASNNLLTMQQQQPQQQDTNSVNANTIINNIRQTETYMSPLNNALQWLKNNVKFGGLTITNEEAIKLYNIFNWQQFIIIVSQYRPVKDGNKRLWFRLPNYNFDKNRYKYAFGALSATYPDKRIIFLCNPDTGAWETYLVNASDIA